MFHTKTHTLYYLCLFQIKQESFLEDINNLLNAGEVPNLFAIDEKQEICEKMRQVDRYQYHYLVDISFFQTN